MNRAHLQALSDLADRLHLLTNTDPNAAIREARGISARHGRNLPEAILKAGTLTDAGLAARDSQAVHEGIRLFRQAQRHAPDNPHVKYNLANALVAKSALDDTSEPEWFINTFDGRREARQLFHAIRSLDRDHPPTSQALTNLGNQLYQGNRWVEAYDYWVDALQHDPTNLVPALNLANMLLARIREYPHETALHRIFGYYARIARRNPSSLADFSGLGALEVAARLPTFRSRWKPRVLSEITDPEHRFIARHRLALIGTIEGVDFRRRRWDDVHIISLIEPTASAVSVPPIFAMVNQLKADFCVARWLAYLALTEPPGDTALYMDTFDYALYGVKPSILVLAQRAAVDVLDRVAVCANEVFACADKPNDITFRTFWRDKGGTGDWRACHTPQLLSAA